MRDTMHNEQFKVAIPPVVVTDNTAQVGNWIDRLGFESLTFAIGTGTLADADATFGVLLEEADADDHSDAVAVIDDDMLSATDGLAPEVAAGFTFAADNATRKIGYVGNKRYARLTITPVGNSGNAPLSALAVLGNASARPV